MPTAAAGDDDDNARLCVNIFGGGGGNDLMVTAASSLVDRACGTGGSGCFGGGVAGGRPDRDRMDPRATTGAEGGDVATEDSVS